MDLSEGSCLCPVCGKSFRNGKVLQTHIELMHSEKYQYKCEQCHRLFPKRYNLERHLKAQNSIKNKKNNVKCSLCDYQASTRKMVIHHYNSNHKIALNCKVLSFNTMEEFETWKAEMERKTKSKFSKVRGTKKLKDGSERTLYVCHRDGNFISKGDNIRHLKFQGSNKINSHCPAKIEVHITKLCVTVNYTDTHVGHELDLGHLNLTNSEREIIATKIASKIPFQEILDEIRNSVTDGELDRIHLLSRKDLYNIVASFNLKHAAVLHKNEYMTTDAWVSHTESLSNTIRLYKGHGVVINKWPELAEEDFFLVVMNDAQIEILEKYGEDCICLDVIHGLNANDLHLYTLMILTDIRQSFPCAFLFSNREDTVAIELFFNTIKCTLGHPLKTKIFMSDTDDTFYNAWCKVMSPSSYQLYSSWHVDRAWRTNLCKIKGKEEQAQVYKNLKTLMFESDLKTFNQLCDDFFVQLNMNPNTKEFANYFQKYKNNSLTWAYCHRTHCGINNNMSLENMHKIIKQFYCEGKKVKRVDKVFCMLMKFIKDKFFDILITLNKGKITNKVKELRARHKRSLTLADLCVVEEENSWTIYSTQNTDIYTVEKGNFECKCHLKCTECNACIHAFHCTCIDSSIKWIMCEHIHLVCLFLKDTQVEASDIILTDNSGDTVLLEHDVDQPAKTDVSKQTFDSVEKRKAEALKKVLNIHSMIRNEKQVDIFEKIISELEGFIKALSNEDITVLQELNFGPPYKKIKIQHNNTNPKVVVSKMPQL